MNWMLLVPNQGGPVEVVLQRVRAELDRLQPGGPHQVVDARTSWETDGKLRGDGPWLHYVTRAADFANRPHYMGGILPTELWGTWPYVGRATGRMAIGFLEAGRALWTWDGARFGSVDRVECVAPDDFIRWARVLPG